MCHCGRLLIFASFALCLFGLFLDSASASTVSSEQGNVFDRKRRIAYYYPQRLRNFAAFDDEDESQDEMRKKRIAFYYPQHAYRGPVYGIDDDTQDEIDRRRRSVLAYPFQGNANYQFSFPIEEEGNKVGNDNEFIRRRRVVPYYFPRAFGFPRYSGHDQNGFIKRFVYYGDNSEMKKKRSADEQDIEDDDYTKKRNVKPSGVITKKSLLLDDLANEDLTSFGYDKRA